jgi:hypothetical protein
LPKKASAVAWHAAMTRSATRSGAAAEAAAIRSVSSSRQPSIASLDRRMSAMSAGLSSSGGIADGPPSTTCFTAGTNLVAISFLAILAKFVFAVAVEDHPGHGGELAGAARVHGRGDEIGVARLAAAGDLVDHMLLQAAAEGRNRRVADLIPPPSHGLQLLARELRLGIRLGLGGSGGRLLLARCRGGLCRGGLAVRRVLGLRLVRSARQDRRQPLRQRRFRPGFLFPGPGGALTADAGLGMQVASHERACGQDYRDTSHCSSELPPAGLASTDAGENETRGMERQKRGRTAAADVKPEM